MRARQMASCVLIVHQRSRRGRRCPQGNLQKRRSQGEVKEGAVDGQAHGGGVMSRDWKLVTSVLDAGRISSVILDDVRAVRFVACGPAALGATCHQRCCAVGRQAPCLRSFGLVSTMGPDRFLHTVTPSVSLGRGNSCGSHVSGTRAIPVAQTESGKRNSDVRVGPVRSDVDPGGSDPTRTATLR